MYFTRLHPVPYIGPSQSIGGLSVVRRSVSNPLVEETLLRHDDWAAIFTSYANSTNFAYSDVRVQRYIFGGPYGANLAEGYWFNNFSTNVEHAIFLPDRVLTLHRYLESLDAPSPPDRGIGPRPPSVVDR